MAHPFLSSSWLDEATKLLRASKEFHHALGGQSATLLTEVTEGPSGTIFVFYEFHDGRLSRAEVANGHAHASSAQFHIKGTYDTFARMQKGELTLSAAYFQRKVRITGDFQRAFRFAPAFLTYNAIVRRVETEY